ncbi:pectate lyase [Cellulophaga phage Nekkels_2]|nr:pectate lyase [Cellulophaga phage Nekkels_2]
MKHTLSIVLFFILSLGLNAQTVEGTVGSDGSLIPYNVSAIADVQDGTITKAKLDASLAAEIDSKTNSSEVLNLHRTSDPTSNVKESNIINAWVKATLVDLESVSTDSYIGDLSLKATKNASGSGVVYSPNYSVEIGKEYVFSCRIKVGGGFITGSNLYLSDKSGAFTQTPIDHTITDWQLVTVTLGFTKTRTRVNFSMSAQPSGAFMLIDDMKLYENEETIKAFPNAYGFGAVSTGGRGGTVRKVTNLNDSGFGSLREAAGVANTYVIFDVAGNIELSSPISVADNVTIFGQTAFRNGGQGITLKANSTNESSLMTVSGKENFTVQYIRFRRGVTPFATAATGGQNLALANSANKAIIDHCSFGWDEDESLTIWDAQQVTVSNSIINHSLKVNAYGRVKTGKGVIIGNNAEEVSLYCNLIGNADQRNALFGGSTPPLGNFEFKNNLIHNWGTAGTYFTEGTNDFKVNIIGNKWKLGNNSILNRHALQATGNTGDLFYLEGNISAERPTDDLDEWLAIGNTTTPSVNLSTSFQQLTPFDYPLQDSPTYTIEELESTVIKQMGVSLYEDKPDYGAKQDYLNGTGSHINIPSDDGGYPVLSNFTTSILDSNSDGIEDSFATTHGITSPNQIIGSYDFGDWIFDNSIGYEAIEVYAYWLTKQ